MFESEGQKFWLWLMREPVKYLAGNESTSTISTERAPTKLTTVRKHTNVTAYAVSSEPGLSAAGLKSGVSAGIMVLVEIRIDLGGTLPCSRL